MSTLTIHILPRQTMSWEEFLNNTPNNSIALDGIVTGGPRMDSKTNHINFDHHDNVVREATMSTSKQVYYAIKGGLPERLKLHGDDVHIFINDTDQDTALALWLFKNHIRFEGYASLAHVNRLLELVDRLDITAGAFPMHVNENLMRNHKWVFGAYTDLRESGKLADADEVMLRQNLEATLSRLDAFSMGNAEEAPLDTRHEILHKSSYGFVIYKEIGSDARSKLFSEGMKGYIALLAEKADGSFNYTIGTNSRFSAFPVSELYAELNKAEGREAWNGSDIVGGCRNIGSTLTWEHIAVIIEAYLGSL